MDLKRFWSLAAALATMTVCSAAAHAQRASDPRDQALVAYKIIQKQDWKGLYRSAAFSEKVAKSLPADPAVFAAQVENGIKGTGNKETVDKVFAGMSDLAVGKAEVKGKKADVPSSCRIKMNDKTLEFKGIIHAILPG